MALVSCPKCTGNMEEGFLLDVTRGANRQATWVQGRPELSFWTGLKIKGKPQRRVTTLRCTRCGYLESYATGL